MNTIVQTDLIDSIISREDVFAAVSVDIRQKIAFLASEYVRDQIDRCAAYRTYADIAVGEGADPRFFPPIPTTVFKVARLSSVADGEVAHWCISSGTQGVQSRVPRDKITLDRLLGGLRAGLSLIRQWHEEDLQVIHLGPETEEAGEVWFPYLMSLTELMYPTCHLNKAGRIDLAFAIELLHDSLRQGKHVGIIGAPFAVADLCREIELYGPRITAGNQVTVVTGGGWKLRSGEAQSKPEFRCRVASTFGMSSDVHVRDAFNQVELNTVILECESHRFHIPPWLIAFSRDPRTLAPLNSGQIGLMSYVDVSAHSYPCVIVSDDFGAVEEGPCVCGRPGPLMTILRRADRGFQRGCALALQTMGGEVRA